MTRRQRVVALLTDYGTRDWYVAAIKGVILSRAPGVQLVDVTHEIPPQDVTAAAFTLAAAIPWFPRGTVFLAVVDPGVGSRRALLAAEADGRYLVGPDNGVLSVAVRAARRTRMVTLSNRRYRLATVGQTFHGRDIMAPAAAHIACGGALASLGPVTRTMVDLPLPPPRRQGRVIRGRIAHIDRFGNLITNLAVSPRHRSTAAVSCRYQHRRVRVVSSYAAGRPGELVALVGSLGTIELAVRNGAAARRCRARRGERVDLIIDAP